MKSNIQLLMEEVEIRKEGNTQQTIYEIMVKHGRNKKHIIDCFKILEQQGIIVVGVGTWKLKERMVE